MNAVRSFGFFHAASPQDFMLILVKLFDKKQRTESELKMAVSCPLISFIDIIVFIIRL